MQEKIGTPTFMVPVNNCDLARHLFGESDILPSPSARLKGKASRSLNIQRSPPLLGHTWVMKGSWGLGVQWVHKDSWITQKLNFFQSQSILLSLTGSTPPSLSCTALRDLHDESCVDQVTSNMYATSIDRDRAMMNRTAGLGVMSRWGDDLRIWSTSRTPSTYGHLVPIYTLIRYSALLGLGHMLLSKLTESDVKFATCFSRYTTRFARTRPSAAVAVVPTLKCPGWHEASDSIGSCELRPYGATWCCHHNSVVWFIS